MDADQKAKSRVDIMFKSLTRFFPDLDATSLRFAISDGFTELALGGVNEEISDEQNQEYEIEYWFQNNDDYDFDNVKVEAGSRQEAIEKVKNDGGIDTISGRFLRTPRGAKSFSIVTNE